jgi:hypothetical protein
MIPIYGPALSVGAELLDAVLEEVRKEEDPPLNASEVAQALRTLTYNEVEEIVDAALRSPEGTHALASQSPAQREAIRQQLLRLPIDFEQIRLKVEADEHADVEQRKDEEVLEIQRLEKALRRHLLQRKYYSAFRVTRRIRRLDSEHIEAKRTESWLKERGREWQHWRFARLGGFSFGGLGAAFGVAGVADGRMPLSFGVLLMLLITLTFAVGGAVAGYIFGRFWGRLDDATQAIMRVDKDRPGG